ncbi:hypothetical protein JZ751_000020 [Albula glossodonta]|uniref:Uncharacterized protein n=1 Tax=Albula glossodonta TaxID=121402 RepID=A0A8T2PUN2_9TELE|nr:hypothetical protein JZ751_000020 [Albula glossodonta]
MRSVGSGIIRQAAADNIGGKPVRTDSAKPHPPLPSHPNPPLKKIPQVFNQYLHCRVPSYECRGITPNSRGERPPADRRLNRPVIASFLPTNGMFGKHRKDERLGDKMERKGSSKSKLEDTQASEEETLRMRLEQESLKQLSRKTRRAAANLFPNAHSGKQGLADSTNKRSLRPMLRPPPPYMLP